MKVIYNDADGRGALFLPWGFGDLGFELEPGVETDLPDELVLGSEPVYETIDGEDVLVTVGRLPLVAQHDDIVLVEPKPKLATGGVVKSGETTIVGDQGPEAVIPTDPEDPEA